MFDRGLFLAARARVSVEALAGRATTLVRAGSELRGPCPLCKGRAATLGAAPRKKKRGASRTQGFAVYASSQSWHCYVCEEGGDVVDLEQALRGGTAIEAARRLAGGDYVPDTRDQTPVKAQAVRDDGPGATDRMAARLWQSGQAFAGSLGPTYLLARGIAPEVVAAAASNLRFHPRANWQWDGERKVWTYAPAMLALSVVLIEGRARATGGIHATYLRPDGGAKASDDGRAKIMWGRQGRAGLAGGAWLIGPAGSGPLIVAEGIETALSMATLEFRRTGVVPRAVAALSLNRLQGGILKDADRCIDVFDPQRDPDKPPFVWPGEAGPVLIGVDRDMSPVRVRGRTGRGKVCEFELSGETRARLCGRLARAAWLAAGAGIVRVVEPAPGCDFNDDLRRDLTRDLERTA